jgi:acyl dehydratase
MQRYFEDLAVGQKYHSTAPVTVTAEAIKLRLTTLNQRDEIVQVCTPVITVLRRTST